MQKWLRIPLPFILCQVSTILLNSEQDVCWLLTWGPMFNVQWEVWVRAVRFSVGTLFLVGCPQALGNEWWGRNVLSVGFFRFDGRCQFFSEELKRQEGGIYIIECEYSSFSDGWSSPNHGTCSDWQSPFHPKQLDVWIAELFPLLITNATLEKPLIFQQSILSHNTRMRSKVATWPFMVSEKKPQNTDPSCSLGMEKCNYLRRLITIVSQFLLSLDLHDEICFH